MIISDDLVVPMKPKRKTVCLKATVKNYIVLRAVLKTCKGR